MTLILGVTLVFPLCFQILKAILKGKCAIARLATYAPQWWRMKEDPKLLELSMVHYKLSDTRKNG
jgi:hypothetical protein